MKTFLSLLMPIIIVLTSMASNYFFSNSEYFTSAFFTLCCLCAITLWIAAISTKKMALHA